MLDLKKPRTLVKVVPGCLSSRRYLDTPLLRRGFDSCDSMDRRSQIGIWYPTRQSSINTFNMSAQQLWDNAASMIAVTEKHPFLVAKVDGTLSNDSFKYYVVQDALYLDDYADCLNRLAESAVREEDSKRLKAFATGAEHAEMALHNSFFKEWDISTEGAKQMPHTLLYTSYLKRVVATRPHKQGLAALLPCFWVYMHVGKCMLKLRAELGDSW